MLVHSSRPLFRRFGTRVLTVVSAAGIVVTATAAAPPKPYAPPAVAAPAAPRPDSAAQERLRYDVRAVHETGVVGVLAEARTGAGRSSARSGAADRRTGTAMPRDGYFRIGSTTKTFVATVVLQLVGEGRLSLDDTIDTWLPGVVSGHGNDGREVTVRQLLQHTSGISEYLRPATSPEQWRRERLRRWRPEQLVALAMEKRPAFAPGAEWGYSNTNYVLLGMIIHKVTGRTWHREVERRILTPLDLRRTLVPRLDPRLPDPHAKAYARFTPDGPLTDVTVHDPSQGDAAGAMISTTGDLNRFFRALLGGKLLAPAQLAQMRQTVPATALRHMGLTGAAYGLGLMYLPLTCGGGYWGHGGDEAGFSTRAGVTEDAEHSVAVETTSRSLGDLDALLRTSRALSTLVDHALCGTARP
ncbi:beta-lactamase family protein [Nonomuraea sp. KC401]|uniref:serine hydrolase domain-containing protein n=1 Tax=unclassified Nonomuraea TaxID=2593643 RepID=UPI0010FECA6B|nr:MULTISPECIES: serine hydrolase domain-containing protein [unclassified Nonomuraea]NBE94958.1 serine hydrolase [Nonomuraea sp. K271]TLF74652.1 beta-lactamase family protein [Nonomuraea sp. KC401]